MIAEPPGPDRLGRGFLWLGWIAGLALLYSLFAGPVERRMDPNRRLDALQTAEFAEVRLRADGAGHYRAPGEINGHAVRFMLDTGATDVAIPGHLAAELGLVAGQPIQVHTARGVGRAYRTRIQTLSIGPIELRNLSGTIAPEMQGEVLLGMNVLGRLEMEQRERVLTLRQTR